jgi:6-pyruvoyltetrahydropterin/6-carboxytetrahydropterin synthase
MYTVTETVFFCYGHRLLDHPGRCAHVHGHNGRAEIEVAAEGLDARGMVADFAEVAGAVKGWIDATLDHRMILRRDDPLVGALAALREPVYLMDESPTAEALARLIFEAAAARGLPVAQVRLWETEHSVATYRPGG